MELGRRGYGRSSVDFARFAPTVDARLAVQRQGEAERRTDEVVRRTDLASERQAANLAEEARQRGRQEGVEAALGESVQERMAQPEYRPGPNAGAISRLAATPGGQTAAFDLQQQQDDASTANERRALEALAVGDEASFQHYQQQSGLKLPAQIVNNARLRGRYAQAALIGEQLYKNDPEKMVAFLTAYMADPSSWPQAIERIGPPRDQPQVSTFSMIQNGQEVLGLLINSRNGVSVQVPTDAEGQPYQTAISGQRPPNQQETEVVVNGQRVIGAFNPADGSITVPRDQAGQPFQAPQDSRQAGPQATTVNLNGQDVHAIMDPAAGTITIPRDPATGQPYPAEAKAPVTREEVEYRDEQGNVILGTREQGSQSVQPMTAPGSDQPLLAATQPAVEPLEPDQLNETEYQGQDGRNYLGYYNKVTGDISPILDAQGNPILSPNQPTPERPEKVSELEYQGQDGRNYLGTRDPTTGRVTPSLDAQGNPILSANQPRPERPTELGQVEFLGDDGRAYLGTQDPVTGVITPSLDAQGAPILSADQPAPPPSERPETYSTFEFQGAGGQPQIGLAGNRGTMRIPTQPGGEPFLSPPGGGQTMSANESFTRFLQSQGIPLEQALAIVTNRRSNPDEIAARTYQAVMVAQQRQAFGRADQATMEQRAREAAQQAYKFASGQWQGGLGAGSAVPPPDATQQPSGLGRISPAPPAPAPEVPRPDTAAPPPVPTIPQTPAPGSPSPVEPPAPKTPIQNEPEPTGRYDPATGRVIFE